MGKEFLFLAENFPISSEAFQFLCHLCVGMELVDDELFDDVTVDELCAVEEQLLVGAIVDGASIAVFLWIEEKVGGDGVVECLEDVCLVGSQCVHLIAVEWLPLVGQVEVVHGIVEDETEHRSVHVVRHFILWAQSCHVVEVESQWALHIGIDGRWGEDALVVEAFVQLLHHAVILLHTDGFHRLGFAGGCEGAQADLLIFAEQLVFLREGLQHESRHLTLVSSLRAGIVEERDAFGSLQETVIIVGIEAHFTFDGRHAISGTERVGDEGCAFVALGYLPFIDGEHDDVAEVEVSGLEQSHHLQTDGRFSVEGDGGLAHQLADQSGEQFIAYVQCRVSFLQGVDSVHSCICHEDAFLVDLQGEIVLVERMLIAVTDHRDDVGEIASQFCASHGSEDASQDLVVGKSFHAWEDHILFREFAQFLMALLAHQLLNERMFQHCRHIFISPSARVAAAMHLQFQECQHQ